MHSETIRHRRTRSTNDGRVRYGQTREQRHARTEISVESVSACTEGDTFGKTSRKRVTSTYLRQECRRPDVEASGEKRGRRSGLRRTWRRTICLWKQKREAFRRHRKGIRHRLNTICDETITLGKRCRSHRTAVRPGTRTHAVVPLCGADLSDGGRRRGVHTVRMVRVMRCQRFWCHLRDRIAGGRRSMPGCAGCAHSCTGMRECWRQGRKQHYGREKSRDSSICRCGCLHLDYPTFARTLSFCAVHAGHALGRECNAQRLSVRGSSAPMQNRTHTAHSH